MKKIIIVLFIFSSCGIYTNAQTTPIDSLRTILNGNNKLSNNEIQEIYAALAYYYSSTSMLDSAQYFYKLALKDTSGLAEKYKAYLLSYEGIVNAYRSRYSEALKMFEKSGAIFKKLGNYKDYYLNLINQGVIEDKINRSDLAVVKTKKAIDYFYDNPFILSKIYGNIGSYFINLSRYDSAIVYLYKALLLKQNLRDTFGMEVVTTNLADAYLNLNVIDSISKVKHYAEKTVLLAKKIGDTIGMAYGYKYLGNFYSVKKRSDSAIYYYNNSVKLFKKYGLVNEYLNVLSDLGYEYLQFGDTTRAKSIYNQALLLAKDNDFSDLIINLSIKLGDLYKNQNKSKALDYYNSAYELSRKIHDNKNIYRSAVRIGELLASSGKKSQAYDFLKISLEYKDSLLNEQKIQAIKDAEAKYKNEKLLMQNKIKDQQIKIQQYKLEEQRRKMEYIIMFLFIFIVISAAFFMIYKTNIKRKYDKRMFYRLIEAQEQTKKELSTALHNDIGGRLAALIIQLESKDVKNNTDLKQEIDAVKYIYEIIRKKSHILSVPSFIYSNLEEELNDLFFIHYKDTDLKVNIDLYSEKGWNKIHPFIQQNLYRIIQELFINSIKHSGAKSVDVDLVQVQNKITLLYNDDGKGYNPQLIKYGHGYQNEILARVRALDGKFEDQSREGYGVNIIIEINL